MAGLKMPSVSLAKKGEISSSKEWLQDQVLKHGSTHADNLEKRRQTLSLSLAQQQKTIQHIQATKKQMTVAYREEIARVTSTEKDEEKAAAIKDALEFRLRLEIMQLDNTILTTNGQMSILNALLLLIDNSSIRCKIEDTNTGRIVGHTRFSSAYYQEQASLCMLYIVALLKPLVDKNITPAEFKTLFFDVDDPKKRAEKRSKMPSEQLIDIVDNEETSDLLETDDPGDILTPEEEEAMQKEAEKHTPSEEDL